MKNIIKNNKNIPASLIKHKKATHSNYDNYPKADKEILRKALLEEQGYICAYCMNSIKNERSTTKIEHFKPQKKFPKLELEYKNLLVVCKGGEGEIEDLQHCDTKKGDDVISINPLNKNCERLVQFLADGTVFSDDPTVHVELTETLNLNVDYLVEERKTILDIVKDEIVSIKAKGTWNRKMLEKEIEKYQTKKDGKYSKYCQIIVYYLTKKLNRLN